MYSINQFVRDLHIAPRWNVDIYFMHQMVAYSGMFRAYIKPVLVVAFANPTDYKGRIVCRTALDQMLESACPKYGDVYCSMMRQQLRITTPGLNLLRIYTNSDSEIREMNYITQLPRPDVAKRLIDKYGNEQLTHNRPDDYDLKAASKKILTSWASKTIQKFARTALAR
jgi:hypothetical protein